ncbi:MAG: hypothetical protein ACK4K0_09065 [Flavobacteriales bacterium]
MLATLFGKKKVSESHVANAFVNNILQVIDAGFEDVAALVNNDPEFVSPPNIDPQDSDRFLLIVVAGNLEYLPKYFDNSESFEIENQIIEKLARVYDMSADDFKKIIKEFQQYINRVNHPSKNTLYGMSKAVFHKYRLCGYQNDYFKSLNVPNPLFLKRMDDIMRNFLWDWESFLEKYKIA